MRPLDEQFINFGYTLTNQMDNQSFNPKAIKTYKNESDLNHIANEIYSKILLSTVTKHDVNRGSFIQSAFNEFSTYVQYNPSSDIALSLESIIHHFTNYFISLKDPINNITNTVENLNTKVNEKINDSKYRHPIIFNDRNSNQLNEEILKTYVLLDWNQDFLPLFNYINLEKLDLNNILTLYDNFEEKYGVSFQRNLTPLRNLEIFLYDNYGKYNAVRYQLRRHTDMINTLTEEFARYLHNSNKNTEFQNFLLNRSVLETYFDKYFNIVSTSNSASLQFNPREVDNIFELVNLVKSQEFKDEQFFMQFLQSYDKSILSNDSIEVIKNFIQEQYHCTLGLLLVLALINRTTFNQNTVLFNDQLINKSVLEKNKNITIKDIINYQYILKKNKKTIPSIGVGVPVIARLKDVNKEIIYNDQQTGIYNQTMYLQKFQEEHSKAVIQEYYTEKYKDDQEKLFHCNDVLQTFKYDQHQSMEDNFYDVVIKMEHEKNPSLKLFFKLFKEHTEEVIVSQESTQIELNQQKGKILYSTYKDMLGNILRLNLQ
jgi:hypothetical protein